MPAVPSETCPSACFSVSYPHVPHQVDSTGVAYYALNDFFVSPAAAYVGKTNGQGTGPMVRAHSWRSPDRLAGIFASVGCPPFTRVTLSTTRQTLVGEYTIAGSSNEKAQSIALDEEANFLYVGCRTKVYKLMAGGPNDPVATTPSATLSISTGTNVYALTLDTKNGYGAIRVVWRRMMLFCMHAHLHA